MEDLDIGNYVQSIMDHCANIFNFIYVKLSTIYKNVNADSTIIIDCDCNDNIGNILKFMKDKYLDPNPQTPSIELYYSDKSSTNQAQISINMVDDTYNLHVFHRKSSLLIQLYENIEMHILHRLMRIKGILFIMY